MLIASRTFLCGSLVSFSRMVHPKDKLKPREQCGVVYGVDCQVCGESYVGETGRSLGERAEEHQKSIEKGDSKSALSQHQEHSGHIVSTPPLIDSHHLRKNRSEVPT